jgi:hypothetical protein
MHTSYAPVRAILWQIYWRSRWGFAAALAYLLVAIATSHWLTPYARTHWGDAAVTMIGLYLGAPCALIIVLIIAAFCLAGTRGGETVPPTHMLVLPISARMLVTVPMAAGAVTVAIVWLIVAYFVLRPADFAVPILRPTAVLTLFLTVFQAIAWTPFAQRWIQGVLTVFAGAGTFGWVLGGIAFGFSRFGPAVEPFVASALVLALVPVAYLFALSGVAMTRRGDSYDWRLWNRLKDRLAAWQKPAEHPFSSPRAAQIWFELRTTGWYPPVMTGATALFFPFMLLSDPSDVSQSWKFLGIFLGLPLLMATVSGGALGNFGGIDTSAKAHSQGPFLFVRPITSAMFIRDKLLAGALVTVMIWLTALPMGLLILLRPGFCQAIIEMARQTPAWKVGLLPPLAVLLLIATTWKQLVEGYWSALTGRAWVMHVFLLMLMFLLMGGLGFGIAAAVFPQYQAVATAALPWIMGILLGVKLAAAILVLRGLESSALLSNEYIVAMIATWIFVVAALTSLTIWLIPPGAASIRDILSSIVLLVPFSRLAGAPLAVEWNRHR